MDGLVIFQRCREAAEDIESLGKLVQRRKDRLSSLGGGMDPAGGSRSRGNGDRMAQLYAALESAENRKRDREEAWIAEQNSADMLLEMVPDQEGEILERYYLNGSTLSETARKMHLTAGYVRARKRDADEAARMIQGETLEKTLPAWYLQKWGTE